MAVVQLRLHLPQNRSLKGKRQMLRPILDRLRAELNAAVAEVGDENLWQSAQVGIAVVSNSKRHAEQMASRAVSLAETMQGDVLLMGVATEVLHVR